MSIYNQINEAQPTQFHLDDAANKLEAFESVPDWSPSYLLIIIQECTQSMYEPVHLRAWEQTLRECDYPTQADEAKQRLQRILDC